MSALSKLFSGSKASPKADPAPTSSSSPRYAGPGRIDFTAVGLPEYRDCYAIVIDDLFTKQELSDILRAAEASSEWEVARVNATAELSYEMPDYRNGERIILDDQALSESIFAKVRPHLHEIEEFGDENWTREGRVTTTKKMVRMNERLRFLRYKKGGFFRRHTDGTYITPDGSQRTYYTLQLYLPSSSDGSDEAFLPATGGSTRFLSSGSQRGGYVDVEAIPGRVLVFQHARLMHTGEDVESGVKCTMRSDILYQNA